jgi:Domain of unknown function (DUF4394)/Calx-beta domain
MQRWIRLVLCTAALLAVTLAFVVGPQTARPVQAVGGNTWSYYILTNDNKIGLGIESQPNLPITPIAVTNLIAGDTLVAIDVRPQNGKLYGLATTTTPGTMRLYAIDLGSGTPFAAALGTNVPFKAADGTTDITNLGTNFGIDFNPTVDRLRVVSDNGSNFRIDPNTGLYADGNFGGITGSVPGLNPDGSINGATTTVDATAYTNAAPNAAFTTQYTLDAVTNSLYIQNAPNSGTQTLGLSIALASVPLDFSASSGFDIPPGVNVSAANSTATGEALAALTVGGTASLYSIELSTGVAALLGELGGLSVRDIAVIPTVSPAIGLSAAGTQLVRFSLATPGTTAPPVTISGITAGETLVGIDGRPATGQLLGLGINAIANTGTLYLIDPQTGAAIVVGTASQIAFVDAGSNPVDLPEPATSGYGIDFNPTVDRLRVITSTGLNFRIIPNTGAPVDGDFGGAAGSVTGINPDGPINGLPAGSSGVSAAAYTNSYGQPLIGGTTTQYTLDAASNRLFIQNPPNAGNQTSGITVTVGLAALDFSDVNGFDIPSGVSVSTSTTPAVGDGYAALTVGATTGMYRIDLTTGNATSLGAIDTGTTAVSGLVVWSAPIEVTISATPSPLLEASGTATITVTRRGGAPAVISYSITAGTAQANTDYADASGVISFSSGEVSKTFSVEIADDATAEPDETFTVQLSGPINGTSSQVITIVDDDRDIFLPLVVK